MGVAGIPAKHSSPLPSHQLQKTQETRTLVDESCERATGRSIRQRIAAVTTYSPYNLGHNKRGISI